MATIDVVDSTKKTVGSVDLNDGVFGVSIKEPLVHSVVVMQRASLRQGTAAQRAAVRLVGLGKNLGNKKVLDELGLDRIDPLFGAMEERCLALDRVGMIFLFPKKCIVGP